MNAEENERQNAHRKAWDLLPGIVNGTASAEQARQVESHVRECPECETELARERSLRAALLLPAEHAPDVELGLQRLARRLDQAGARPAKAPARRYGLPRSFGMVLAGVGLVELVALAALLLAGARLVMPAAESPSPLATYRTLSEAGAPGADRVRLRLVFDGSRPVAELQALLRAKDLVIVDGPSDTGVWSLGFGHKEQDADAAAKALRALPGVMFAEPVGLPK
jgi:anti-sigma factor RsiW